MDLDPARGSESNKRRPAVIVCTDAANMTAAVERIGERLGLVPASIMLKIDESLRLHLAL